MAADKHDMNILEHLDEMRGVLIRSLVILLILFPVAFWAAPTAIDMLVFYTCPEGFELKYFAPLEPLWVQLKLALLLTAGAGLPYIAWQFWRFIAPGLYPRERFWALRLAFISWMLFLAGAALALLAVMPLLMKFSAGLSSEHVQPVIGLEKFISMAGTLTLGFGVMFQLPLLLGALTRLGLVDAAAVRRKRAWVIIFILTMSAIMTPPDIISQLLLAVPVYLMFELGLLLAVPSKNVGGTAAEEEEEETEAEQPPEFEIKISNSRPGGAVCRPRRSRQRKIVGFSTQCRKRKR